MTAQLALTPTWAACLPILVDALKKTDGEAHALALEELKRMAQAADRFNADAAKARAASLARAELVIEGNHPWVDLAALLEFYGLDTSFVWTPETLAPYVDAAMRAEQE